MKTGIVKCGYAPLDLSGDAPSWGTPVYFADAAAGTREYEAVPKGDVHTVWANSSLVYLGAKNSGYDISLTLIDIIDDIAKKWYGDVTADIGAGQNSKTGIAESGKAMERPHFALILSEETTDGVGRTNVFFNVCAGKKPTISGKTTEDGDWDDQFPEYELTAAPIIDPATDKPWVKIELPGIKNLTEITLPNEKP